MKGTLLWHHQHYLGDISLNPFENTTGRISHCALRLLAAALTSLIVRKFFLTSYLKYSWTLTRAEPHTSWSFFRTSVALLLSIEGNGQFEFSSVSKMSVLRLFY